MALIGLAGFLIDSSLCHSHTYWCSYGVMTLSSRFLFGHCSRIPASVFNLFANFEEQTTLQLPEIEQYVNNPTLPLRQWLHRVFLFTEWCWFFSSCIWKEMTNRISKKKRTITKSILKEQSNPLGPFTVFRTQCFWVNIGYGCQQHSSRLDLTPRLITLRNRPCYIQVSWS